MRPWDWTIRGLAFHGKTIQPTPVLQGGFMEVAVNPLLGLVDWSGGMLRRPLFDVSGVWNSGLAKTFEPPVRFGFFTQPALLTEA